jgi:hypothetical protein
MVKASGNDRGEGIAPGTPHLEWRGSGWVSRTSTKDSVGPYDCIPTFGNAKNLLCVGAVPVMPNGFVGNINTFSYSGCGPTDDGRIKPDLVAASGNILSVGSATDSAYASLGGTSMAAPNITGSLLLLQEYQQQLKGRYFFNATLKALAIHSARRCKPAVLGPDYECGWGIPDFAKAIQFMQDSVRNSIVESVLHNQDSFEMFVYINATDTLRATLAWTDPKAANLLPVFNDSTLKLVNDLDLRLYNLNDSLLAFPFILNPNIPAAPATTGDNFRDNVEQLFATALPAAWYKLKIKHKGVLQNTLSQKFSLIVSGRQTTAALPVSYLSWEASPISPKEISLSWVTAQEINNKQFDVLHGLLPQEMQKVATLAGKGNAQTLSRYQFNLKQENGFVGTQYFQLRQIDWDGSDSLSNTLAVTFEIPLSIAAVYPNPFSDYLLVRYVSVQAESLLSIYNQQGKLVFSDIVAPTLAGETRVQLANESGGMYYLVLQNRANGETVSFKVIKQ